MLFDYRAFFSKNILIKLFSAFIGISIWFWVNMTSTRNIVVPLSCRVRFYNAHPSVRVTSKERNIRLKLKGRRLDIVANLDKLVAFVDISKAGAPPVNVKLPVETFVPGRVEVVSIRPKEISVSVTTVSTPSARLSRGDSTVLTQSGDGIAVISQD